MSPGRVTGVVGHPVEHSLSPALHNAAYRALGLDWSYHAFDVAPGELAAAVAGAKALGLRGLSVTMPHKEEAAFLADRRSRAARRLAACNTLVFESSGTVAESTDGEGFLADLREGAGFEPEGRSCAVIGAGGVARAVILALSEAGAREILVVNRTPVNAFRAAAVARGRARVGRPAELQSTELVVQATPVGMTGVEAGRLPADPRHLGSGQLVVDLVYRPAETEFLAEAARKGARVRNGLGMLVRQAGLQVTLFTGSEAPLEEMWQAIGKKEGSPRKS